MRKMLAKCLAWVYQMLLRLSQATYRSIPFRIKKVNAWVISVGNITWGGTGKTPMVLWLAQILSENGKRVAVLTRGYGKDEVAELQKRLPAVPILVGRNRVKTAREAIKKYQADVILLDDGFQHIRLHRDIDVVNINATLPFGPGGLIPLGTLREPLEHLSRAHLFVLTKSDIGAKNLHWIRQRLGMIQPGAVIFEAVHKPIQLADFKRNQYLPLGELKGKKVAALSAIGDPYSFEKTIENQGAQILLAARYDDHHEYTIREIKEIAGRCKEVGVKDVVTTQKDYVRLEPVLKKERSPLLSALNWFVLQIEFEMSDEEAFIRRCFNPKNG